MGVRNGSWVCALALLAAPGAAQLAKITAFDAAPVDKFGNAVALSGGFAVVGAREKDDVAINAGAAYLFALPPTGDFWFEGRPPMIRLVPGDGAGGDFYGTTVAIDGDLALVGAPSDDNDGMNSGSVHLFSVPEGQLIRKLAPMAGGNYDQFGVSLGISGEHAVIGSGNEGPSGFRGVVGVYWLPGGQEVATFAPEPFPHNSDFGLSVAVSDGYAIAGAGREDTNGTDSGAAYLFSVPEGEQVARLEPNDAHPRHNFGQRVAISGGYALVAADDDGIGPGAAYLFSVPDGQQVAKLTASDGENGDQLGWSVAISGGLAVVGAFDPEPDHKGAAYLFSVPAGRELAKLVPSGPPTYDSFGSAVAVDGNRVLVGSPGDDDQGNGAGAVYVW